MAGHHHRDGVISEVKEIGTLAIPIVVASTLAMSMSVVDIAMVGHLGEIQLAAAGLANLTFNFLHFPLVGTSSAFDTLLSQSFGARNYNAYKEWFRTGVIVLLLLSAVVCLFLGLSNTIYAAIGQKPELAALAGDFCIHLIPGYPPFVLFLALTKYLQTQGILAPSVVVGLLANLFNAAVNYLLIYHMGMGFKGAPIATSLARWFQLLAMLSYIFYTHPHHAKTWPVIAVPLGFARKAKDFMRLGVPGALMFGLEGWAFEATTLMATYLNTVALDAHTILLNTIGFTFMSVAFALGVVASIRIGHLLGSNNSKLAILSSRILLAFMCTVQCLLAAFYIFANDYIGKIYSDDAEVVKKVATIAHIAALFQIFDGLQAYVAGILKGMGHQSIAAVLNFIGFWVIGTVLGGILAFIAGFGVSGIWWGLCVGVCCTSCLGMYILSRIDYDKEAASAQHRVVAVSVDETFDQDREDTTGDDIELFTGISSSTAVQDPDDKAY